MTSEDMVVMMYSGAIHLKGGFKCGQYPNQSIEQ